MMISEYIISLLPSILLVSSVSAIGSSFASQTRSPLVVPSVSAVTVDFTSWFPPEFSDVRSPCPGLNALANHGFLPRNGKNINLPTLTTALKSGLNVGSDFSHQIGSEAISLVSPDPQSGYFDLDQLNKHNVIEHDGSLSRSDYYASPDHDNHDFNQTIFNQVLSFYEGMRETSIDVAAKAHYARVKFERGEDRNFTYGATQYTLAYGESALYLSTMGDPMTGVAPLEFVKILFEQERLPFIEGWRPTCHETNLTTLTNMGNLLMAASGEPAISER